MPTDIRKSLFPKTSIRAERAGEAVEREERQRRRSDLISRGRAIKDGSARKAKWERANVELVHARKRRYRERKPLAIASYWMEYHQAHRFYRAAYRRAKRRLQRISPPLPVEELQRRCRRIANRLAMRCGEGRVG